MRLELQQLTRKPATDGMHIQLTPMTSTIEPYRQHDFLCCCYPPERWQFFGPVDNVAIRHRFGVLLCCRSFLYFGVWFDSCSASSPQSCPHIAG